MAKDLSSWNILLVEDEEDAQEVVKTLLEPYGVRVASAFSGEEALDILEHLHPTLAIVDLALPNIDGWEVLASMKANPALADVPAVAMTAYHSIHVAQEAIAAGFAAYFPKPINARTFVEDLIGVVV